MAGLRAPRVTSSPAEILGHGGVAAEDGQMDGQSDGQADRRVAPGSRFWLSPQLQEFSRQVDSQLDRWHALWRSGTRIAFPATAPSDVAPRAMERWVADESGVFHRADDPVPDDPLAKCRQTVRTVLTTAENCEVVEYRDGWGNYERVAEYAPGAEPVPIWKQKREKVARPTVPGAALGKIAYNVSGAPKNVAWMFACRARPWQRARTARCRVRRLGKQAVQVSSDGTAVSVAGVETCSSVWGCPTCAQAIYTERAEEVKTATKGWRDRGPNHVAVLLTVTIRHQRYDNLRWLRKGVSNSWRSMWQGRRAKLLRAELGIVHTIRALEVTEGPHGWHPHLHTVCFLKLREPPTDDQVWTDEQVNVLRNRWIDAVERTLGVGALPNWERGLTVSISHKDDYVAKLGLEIASIAGKRPRMEGYRTPWQLLREATDGTVSAQALWREYVDTMIGARQLTWSRGSKKAFGIRDRTDQELAEATEKPKVTVFNISGWLWDDLVKVPGWLPAFVQAVREDPSRAASMLPPTSKAVDDRSWYQFDRGS